MITRYGFPSGLYEQEVTPLTIAADLAYAITLKSLKQVSDETQTSVDSLLSMIELKKNFNRRVLRYLGYRRRVTYVRAY